MTRIEKESVAVPVIVQSIGGDLRLRGRDENMLIVDGDDPHVEQMGDGQPYLVRCGGDCRISVPDTVDVVVQQVNGDAKLTDLGGKTEVGTVNGDLVLRSVQSVQVKSVSSDLRIKRAAGNVTVESVGSDATIREVEGTVWVAAVGSDLYLRNVTESCVAEKIGSDLVLHIDFSPDREYRFCAGSDILCRVEPDTNARFVLPGDLPVVLDVAAEITEDEDGLQTVTLGDGSAAIYIEQADSLRLVGEEEDYVFNLGSQIEEEIEVRLAELEDKLSQQLEGLDERLKAHTEHWVSQAERAADLAQQQASRAVERVRRSMDRRKTKRKREAGPRRMEFSWGGTPPPAPTRPPTDPVSEQERLVILQMVQENKISVEEAERLLAALES